MGPGERLFKVRRTNRGVSLGLLARKRQFKRKSFRSAAKQESGYVDLALGTRVLDTTGAISLIATVAQGASTSQRVGKKISLKSIQIRGQARSNSATTYTSGAMLIVYDKRPDGNLPAITAILDTASADSFNNDTNSGRFRIIRRYDWTFSGNSTAPATGNEVHDINEFISLKGLPTVYKAAGTGAIGDIEQGALYVVTVGTDAAGTGAAAAICGFRTRYVDV